MIEWFHSYLFKCKGMARTIHLFNTCSAQRCRFCRHRSLILGCSISTTIFSKPDSLFPTDLFAFGKIGREKNRNNNQRLQAWSPGLLKFRFHVSGNVFSYTTLYSWKSISVSLDLRNSTKQRFESWQIVIFKSLSTASIIIFAIFRSFIQTKMMAL